MANIVPFESAKLPSFLQGADAATAFDEITSGGAGFPVLSIKSKIFTLRRGQESQIIMDPNSDPDEQQPARFIEGVIIKGNTRDSKIYYVKGYEEGSDDKPVCYSNDGIAPAADAAQPQSSKCATCKHNEWGSRISESGTKGKSCADARRIAFAPGNQLNDPMLIRVPAASLKTMTAYADLLKKRNVAPFQVITRIGFDYSVAYPALTFKPLGFVDEAQYREIMEMRDSSLVSNIIGLGASFGGAPAAADAEPFETPKAETPKPAAAKPDAPKPVVKKAPVVDAEPAAEPEPDAAPPKAAAKPAPKPEKKSPVIEVEVGEDLTTAIGNMLDGEDD